MADMEKVCGNCEYAGQRDCPLCGRADHWCDNPGSNRYGGPVDGEDTCEEFSDGEEASE